MATGQREFSQIFPKAGWVEHDPVEIWRSQFETAVSALADANLTAKNIAALGITNQRETTLIWDRISGEPVHNAIVWQDRRTSAYCTSIRDRHGEFIRQRTGLEVDAYFSASKIRWLLDNIEGVAGRAKAGELAFGTVDSWLIWKLTSGRMHITDVSNASRTLLFDIHNLDWSDELLEIFDIPEALLPEVRSSSEVYGPVDLEGELQGIPIAGIAGDQQAALFGQTCFDVGATKNTYGTGCFMLQNTGTVPVTSGHRLLTTVGWKVGERTEYALEGSVFIGGAVIQWLRDSLAVIESASEVEQLTLTLPDNGGVYFVPAFAGLGSPHWDQDARGLIIGLTRGTGRAHIVRAAVESMAYQTADLLHAMQADSGIGLDELRVDGGAVRNNFLLQFQADILQIPVVRSTISETTALGAAYLAGLSVGYWNSKNDLADHWREDARFEPQMTAKTARALRDKWDEAVRRSLRWSE